MVVIALAAILVHVRDPIGSANVALALAAVVVAAAALGGLLPGFITGVVAAFAFNFFHAVPHYSLRVDDGQDVWTVVLERTPEPVGRLN